MDNTSNELTKLNIDKSKLEQAAPQRNGALILVVLLLIGGAISAFALLRRPAPTVNVQIVRPRAESTSQSAVLVATGYVIAHRKIQVGSKIAGRVAWIGV